MDRTNETEAVRFFYENGSYSYDPDTETPDQGRLRCARQYAADEAWAAEVKVEYIEAPSDFPWDGDDPLPEGCILSDFEARVWGPACSHCGVRKRHVANLCSVAYMPGDNYPRVIKAELAGELRAHLAKET